MNREHFQRLLILVAAGSIAGCASKPVEPIIRTVEVHVPVAVVRTPAAELTHCGTSLPIPTFQEATNERGEALVGLSQPENQKNLELITGLDACNRAWRAWSKP